MLTEMREHIGERPHRDPIRHGRHGKWWQAPATTSLRHALVTERQARSDVEPHGHGARIVQRGGACYNPLALAKKAALFDLDRTLLRVDSARLYTRFRRDRGEASLIDALRVALWATQYTLGVIDAPKVARKALESFRGRAETWLIESCAEWFPTYVLPELQQAGRRAVKQHREAGDFVAIVTGATRYVAEPVAAELGIEHVICSELEVDVDGLFTGRVVEPLCYGLGKLQRAARVAEREGFRIEEAYFYSDSITDLPLLEVVKAPIVINPDRRLRKVAQKRGWPIESW
jgi:HAD superfamily hydrolase (TIGR01490 family)